MWHYSSKMNPAQLSAGRLLTICSARVSLLHFHDGGAAVIPLITVEWELSATAAGAIVSSFTLCYAASVFGFAWAADHFGAKRMVVVSAIAAAAASAAFGFLARDWWSAARLRPRRPGAGALHAASDALSDEVAPASRGRAMGWLIASTSVGYCARWARPRSASRSTALAGGVRAERIATCGRGRAARRDRAVREPHPSAPAQVRLRDEIVHNRDSRLLIAGYTGHSWELLGMWAWVPAFLAAGFALKGARRKRGISGAWLSALLHAVGAVSAFTMGRCPTAPSRRCSWSLPRPALSPRSSSGGWFMHRRRSSSFRLVRRRSSRSAIRQ